MFPAIHWITLATILTTVTELPEYIRRANELLNEAERKAIIDHLAAHPRARDIMEGTSGIRVIYYYHDQLIPLYLLTVFGKNEQSNISKSERNELAKLVGVL